MAYAGYFKDASVGNTLKTVVHWAHNWIIGAVVVRPYRLPNWAIALPVFFALYRKRTDCDRRHPKAPSETSAWMWGCQWISSTPRHRLAPGRMTISSSDD